MINYDLCIAWNWKHDNDFIRLIDCACQSKGLSLLTITPDNLTKILHSLNDEQISFKAFFDRASDTDKHFIPIDQWADNHDVYRINAHERAVRSWNKATVHYELIRAGIYTPYTIILPPYEEQPHVTDIDLSLLGDNFFIKPAHGGGGEGVKKGATTINQVLIARQENPAGRICILQYIKKRELSAHQRIMRRTRSAICPEITKDILITTHTIISSASTSARRLKFHQKAAALMQRKRSF